MSAVVMMRKKPAKNKTKKVELNLSMIRASLVKNETEQLRPSIGDEAVVVNEVHFSDSESDEKIEENKAEIK